MNLARRTALVSGSQTSETRGKAKQLRDEGIPVINFAAGELDIDTCDAIKAATKQAIDAGHSKYTDTLGIAKLKEAIAGRVLRDTGVRYETDEVGVTVGAKQALFETAMVLFEDGDEVIIPAPYWVTFPMQVMLAGAIPVIFDTAPSGFQLDPARLEKLITPKTKGILLNTPNNPTGVVYDRATLEAVAALAIKHDLWVVFDECYGQLTYSPYIHHNIVSLVPELRSRTVVINSFSKTYSITGWRVGFVCGPREVIKAIKGLQSHTTSNTCSIVQYGALAALDMENDAFVQHVRALLAERRNCAVEAIRGISGVSCPTPQGAFYIFLDVGRKLGMTYRGRPVPDVEALSTLLLEVAHVAVVAGSGFGADQHVRISYALSKEEVTLGLSRMGQLLDELE
jgi:aspartate aminotransferase